jgi:hypothetical protein
MVIILVAALGACAYMFWQYREAKEEVTRLSTLEGQQEVAQQEISEILDKVKKHIILPEDEQPSIAEIKDVENLKKDFAFYKDASNGDKLIIYENARKAIIYSSEKDLIVNVGPIFIDEDAQQQQEQADEETQTDEEVSPTPSPTATPTSSRSSSTEE